MLMFSIMGSVSGAEPSKIVGSFSLPRQWHVFGPLTQDHPVASPDVLRTIPAEMNRSGHKLKPRTINVTDPFHRQDLARLIGGTERGKTAYVFIPFTSPADMEATLGMGADWWLQAWLDGVLIKDTNPDGNGTWPPTIHDHLATVRLSKGAHVLAVRFSSGSGSSILALGGPDDLRRGRPPYPLFQNEPMPAENLVANGGFETGPGGEPFVPSGWENGEGLTRFLKTELIARTNAPISGSRSLELNTLCSDSVKRRLQVPLSVDIDTCYEVSFKAHALEGAGYASVSVRDDVAGRFNTGFIRAIGAENTDKAIKTGELGARKAYYYFDTSNPYLVVEAHGPVHMVLDDVCIVPVDRIKMWSTFSEQRAPWKSEWNWDTLTEAVVTPHTSWAKPYAGGRLKVLSLMPRNRQRLTVELAQRLSMQYTPVFFEYRKSPATPSKLGSDYWIYDADGDPKLFLKEADAMGKLAQPSDCIVIAELKPAAITPRMADAILEKVAAGAGLIITGPATFKESLLAEALAEKNRTTEEINWVRIGASSAKNGGFFQYGKGRIASWSGRLENDRAALEDNLSYMIKAMLWASRKLPRIRMQDIEMPGRANGVLRAQVEWGVLPGKIKVKASSSFPVPTGVSVIGWMENYRGDPPISLGAVTLADDHLEAAFDVPRLPAGRHRVHFQIRHEDNRIEDWSTAILNVAASVGIKAIEIDRGNQFFTAGDPVKGRVILTAPLEPDQRLRIQLTDADGRLWAMDEMKGSKAVMEFVLETDPAVVLIHRVKVEIMDAAGPLANAEEEFAIVRAPTWYDSFFDYQLWVIPTDNFLACGELRKCGITSSFHERTGRNHAVNNIRAAPQVWVPDWGVKIAGDTKHAPVRNPCLNDPEFRAKLAQNMKNALSPVTKFGPLAYSFAHEWNCRSYGRLQGEVDTCFCATCMESFRQFTRAEYGSIVGVNAAWGTDFKEWEDVAPVVLADAVKTNQIPRWIDHRRHVDRMFADFLKFLMTVLRDDNPEAQGVLSGVRVGLTTLDSYSGVDFWLLYHDAEMAGYLDPYILSFMPPRSKGRHLTTRNMPLWHPDKNTGNENLFRLRLGGKPWINLLEGAHGFTYYEEYLFKPPNTPWHPILKADLTVGVIRPANEAVAQIRSGIGHFIFESKQMDSGIAILYSRSSEHAATAWQALHRGNSLATKISPPDQMGFYTRALKACGYQYTMISDDQVAGQALIQKGCRLLILPFAQAISTDAAEQIREFVKGGGILLADIRPGMTDPHGKPRATGSLDDVFGVRHQTSYHAYEPAEDTIRMDGVIGKTALTNVLPRALCGPAVQVAGADIQGKGGHSDIPAFLVNRMGQGQAVLMNFILPELDDNALQMMDDLLTACGLRPLFGVEEPEGRRSRSSTIVQESKEAPADAEGFAAGAAGVARPVLNDFVNGRIHCFGFWYPVRRGIGYENLVVTPPTPGHIYDLKSNEYLGRQERFEVSFPLEDTAAYASVPYRIQQPTLTLTSAPSSTKLPTIHCLARIRPDEAANEKHVIKFRIFAPEGSEWRDFAATKTTMNGKATHVFKLPINAPEGKWKVVAREALSGLENAAETNIIR